LDVVLQRRYHSLGSKISVPGWNETETGNEAHSSPERFATGWDFNVPKLEIVSREHSASVSDDSRNPGQEIYT
ncbi:hypothetical protein, partial [Brevibacillus parabrevis]